MKLATLILVGPALALLSCGGGSSAPAHVEITGKTPAEAADIAAHAICTHDAQCGHVSVMCMSGGAAGGSGSSGPAPSTTCVGKIEPVSYDECYADANGDLTRVLGCPALTPDQLDMLERCFNTLVAVKCPTQAEVDARARASEMGNSPQPEGLPPECAILGQAPAGCS